MSVVIIKKRVPKVVTIVKRSLLSVPVLLSVTPNVGPTSGGVPVTLRGYGFTGANASNLLQPGFTVVSDTTITGVTVAHAVGAVSATVSNASYTSAPLASAFTYSSAPAPTVTSASLASVPWRATAITLTGTGFVSGATVDMSVDSGGTWTACTSVTFGSSTSITATTPVRTQNYANTLVRFRVTNPDAQTGTLGAGNVAVQCDPLDFSGLRLDLAADVGVTQSAGAISLWADQSGVGNDVSQAGSNKPTLVTGQIAGKPIVRGDGSSQNIGRASFSLGAGTDTTFFFAIKLRSAATVAGILLLSGPGNLTNIYWNGGSPAFTVDLNGATALSGAAAAGAMHLATLVLRSNNTQQLWIDGVSVATGTSTAATPDATSVLTLFGDGVSQLFCPGDDGEILIYRGDKTSDRANIESYLKKRWQPLLSEVFGTGNSVAAGIGASTGSLSMYPRTFAALDAASPNIYTDNYNGHPGYTVDDLAPLAASEVDSNIVAGKLNICLMLEVINTIGHYVGTLGQDGTTAGNNALADHLAYYAARKAAGWDVVIAYCVWVPFDSQSDPNRVTAYGIVNAGLAAAVGGGSIDAVVRLDQDSRLVPTSLSPTTYFADGTHPSDAGHQVIADLTAPVIEAKYALHA